MHLTEWTWRTHDGLAMHSQAWEPVADAKGILCLVHGMGEHIGRYYDGGVALTQAGYILTGFDLRGFGQSEGRRGHTPSLEAYFDDIDGFLAQIALRYPTQARFLYGFSMGGILVLAYTPLRQPKVAGVIAAAPGLKTALEEQLLKVGLVKLLGNVFPTLTFKSGLDPAQLSNDPGVIEAYAADPLVHNRVTAAWGKSMLHAIDLVYQSASRFPCPVLLMHGAEDKIAYPIGSQRFVELAPKDKVTFKLWDGFKHELHTDPESRKVFAAMIDWLNTVRAY